MLNRIVLGALAGALFAVVGTSAQAAPDAQIRESVAACDPYNPINCLRPNADGSINVKGGTGGTSSPSSGSTGWGGSSAVGAYHNYLVGTSSTPISGLGSGPRSFLDLSGQNTGIDIWCNLTSGQVAQISPSPGNGNDSFKIAAGGDARWENSFAPADPVACIASQPTSLWAGAH